MDFAILYCIAFPAKGIQEDVLVELAVGWICSYALKILDGLWVLGNKLLMRSHLAKSKEEFYQSVCNCKNCDSVVVYSSYYFNSNCIQVRCKQHAKRHRASVMKNFQHLLSDINFRCSILISAVPAMCSSKWTYEGMVCEFVTQVI